jgi:hypothetical protein
MPSVASLRSLLALLAVAAVTALPARAQAIDTARVLSAFRDADLACRQDGGRLWGRSLCGPIALVDRQTRLLIANDSAVGRAYLPLGAAYVTTAPAGTGFANTSFELAGRQWAMIMLPLPDDRFDRVTLVMHEVFHREQQALGLRGQDPPNNQLDLMDGRIWLRLELRALTEALDALTSDTASARSHVKDAVLFRARRRVLYPLADSLEPALEMQEGLAEYTGERLAMTLTGAAAGRVARNVRSFESSRSYVRSFAYATGPALGVLLDQFAPGWRTRLHDTPDPARVLAEGVGFRAPADLVREADRVAARYGADDVVRGESARDSVRRPLMAEYRERLVAGPVLTLTQTSLSRNFDPTALIGFDVSSTVYPTGSFSAEWGTLEVKEGGALLSNDFGRLQLRAPTMPPAPENRVVVGPGWTLTLAPGWRLVGVKAPVGSYVVAKGATGASH